MTKTKQAAKHTPGPWTLSRQIADFPGAVPQEGESGTIYEYIVKDSMGPVLPPIFEEADARLIAAAPELLAAARTAVALHEQSCRCFPGGSHGQDIDILRDAIAKAIGEMR